ncbi:hypothetical protein [Tessaracoccus sp. ZS01]|uniref:hypothetical protein n=1 Tax=Tessaracoccus sp. ZS01 TaxID=1906324 RepID=UPI0011817545|nr:hypothetical protein [Tessaracoccus sp. ZS01]
MNRLKTVVLAALMAVGGVLLPTVTEAPESAALDVYTTPGTHTLNGRQWMTVCAAYSPTIDRCRTEIYATQITRDAAGRFTQANGWAFNNLTYKPVAHNLWGNNPLATPGEWTEGGRRWRTECGTAATGKDGCRSYIHGTAYTSVGGRIEAVNQWMFNNIVRVTPGSMKVGLEADPIRRAPDFLHGRRFFTLGTIITNPNEGGQARGTGRLSQVELDPAGKLGTFRESYWSFTWDMARESDYGAFRTSIADRPTGCTVSAPDNADRTRMGLPALPAGTCDVRAARSFTAKPTVRYGTYDHSGGNRLRLFWNNSFITETYLDATAAGRRPQRAAPRRPHAPGQRQRARFHVRFDEGTGGRPLDGPGDPEAAAVAAAPLSEPGRRDTVALPEPGRGRGQDPLGAEPRHAHPSPGAAVLPVPRLPGRRARLHRDEAGVPGAGVPVGLALLLLSPGGQRQAGLAPHGRVAGGGGPWPVRDRRLEQVHRRQPSDRPVRAPGTGRRPRLRRAATDRRQQQAGRDRRPGDEHVQPQGELAVRHVAVRRRVP